MIANAVASAVLNILLLTAIPGVFFVVYQRRRNRGFAEIARRSGLQVGEVRYIAWSAAVAAAVVLYVVIWPPRPEPFTRPGSAQATFAGLGPGVASVVMALLYGVVKTGFPEELLFRGLIAGSLSRRFPLWRANLIQAAIFLLPHLVILRVMPEMWPVLPIVFAGALFFGWVRIRSGSIVGPWIVHATANVTICLHVAIRTAG